MVNSCSAFNCLNRVGSESHGEKITFHRFPQRPELRRLWTAAVKRYDPVTKKQWEPRKHACLCSEHFVPEDFRYNRGYRLLRDGAIPTRFNYLTTQSNKTIASHKKVVDRDVAQELTVSAQEPTVSSALPSNLDDTSQNKSEEVSKMSNSKTNNYSEWLLENLFSRRMQDIFCDTVLIIGKQQLKAHSVVLSAGSTFFHSALKLYSKPGLRYLTLPGIDYDVLQIAVRFIYTGKFEVGTKYVKSDQRAELLNSLRKLGLNLEHLEECEIIHNSDEEVVTGSLKRRSADGAKVQDRAESSSANKQSTNKQSSQADIAKVQDIAESSSANKQSSQADSAKVLSSSAKKQSSRADVAKVLDITESSSANKQSSRADGAKVQDRAQSSSANKQSANKQSSQADSTKVQDIADSSSANKESSHADSAKVLDRVESSSAKEQSSGAVSCDRVSKSVVPVKSKTSQDQSSLVSSSLHVEEIEGGKVEDVGCDVALSPAKGSSSDCRTPMDCNSVLSEVNNGWVLRSKTGVHFVEVPRELLAEIELESRKNLPNQTGGKVRLDSLKKSFHSRAKRVRVNEGDVAAVRARRILPKPGPSCSATSAVDPVHEESPIIKQKQVHRKKRSHVCPFCGKEFLGISHYDVHLRKHTGEKPYSCKLCGKTFGIAANLRRHMRSHADDRRYLCDLCGHAFIQKSTLEDHVASKHTRENKYMCMSCGKFFPTLGCYRAHSKRHQCGYVRYRREYNKLSEPMRRLFEEAVLTASIEEASRFVCRICKKDYASKNILALHLKRHSIAKPFVCNVCNKSFWQHSHLAVHERSHTGETPFTCGTCGKGFISRGRLAIHEMQHTDKKPYKCVTCGSSFSVQAYLKSHMRVHADDRPYECKLCGKKYRKEINLQFHLNRAHDCNENS